VLALKSADFSSADVQSDVLLPSRMLTTAFSTDHQLRRFVIRAAIALRSSTKEISE